jgi:hypothetical protein
LSSLILPWNFPAEAGYAHCLFLEEEENKKEKKEKMGFWVIQEDVR